MIYIINTVVNFWAGTTLRTLSRNIL